MKHKLGLITPLVLVLAGCTDSMDSLCREFRNANNETIDAMSMIVDEESCHRMELRVFKPVNDRYKDIERRLDIWKSNRATDKELVEETFNSNSFYLYLAELQVNKQRFSLERMRLANLYKQYLDREMQRLRDAGDPDPVITEPQKLCPKLHEMITQQKLKQFEDQITRPKIIQMVSGFPSLQGVKKEYPAMHKVFVERMDKFAPKDPVVLIW